jgi:hypothetical protein
MSECEPTDHEVSEAIDRLAEQAKRSFTGTSGNAWARRMEIQRQADLLKAVLNTKPDEAGAAENIRRRCQAAAERLERMSGPSLVEAVVSADLLLEASSLLRGYGQCLLIDDSLTPSVSAAARNTLTAVLHQMEHGEASDCIDRRDEDVGSWKHSADDLRWCREQIKEVLKSLS